MPHPRTVVERAEASWNEWRMILGLLAALQIMPGATVLPQDDESDNPLPSITASEAWALAERDSTVIFLDVRSLGEYESTTGHLNNAIHLHIQELAERVEELERYRMNTIIAYCAAGVRSAKATAFLREKGFSVLSLEGGIIEWTSLDLPVVKRGKEE